MSMNIKINKKLYLGKNKPPLIIAEISGNHCGKKSIFLNHIKLAAKFGADLVKIQTYEPLDITHKSQKHVIRKGIWKSKSLWSIYKKAHTPFKWHEDAFLLAKKIGVVLFSTPFSIRAVDLLEKYNVPIYKISSFEITDYKLINYIASKKKPIIISTGNSSLLEIKSALKLINKFHNKVIILHCVSNYPTLEKEADISRITLLSETFPKNHIGLSDHTNDIFSALASIPLGATIIEKHFKTSSKINSHDAKFSITPDQLLNLKQASQRIFNSLGKKEYKEESVNKNTLFFRRSIYAKVDISKGSKITDNNIICLRPKIGIGSEHYFKILGKVVRKAIKKNSPILKKFIT